VIAVEFDTDEVEKMFSKAEPKAKAKVATKTKPQLVTLLDPKRENNCGIAMAHIKIPHAQVVAALLALDPGMLDHDPDEQANLQVRTQAAVTCNVWDDFDRLLVIAEWRSCKHAARPMRSGRYWNITMKGTHPAPRITCVRWTPCFWS